jgi:hypothetical protein
MSVSALGMKRSIVSDPDTVWEYSHMAGVFPIEESPPGCVHSPVGSPQWGVNTPQWGVPSGESPLALCGSAPTMWECSPNVGVLPQCGSTPTMWEYAHNVGVLPHWECSDALSLSLSLSLSLCVEILVGCFGGSPGKPDGSFGRSYAQ